jgi:hypothetical protein
MKILELFSGTGSIGKVARDMGHDVLSLDKFMEADIQQDIMNWNYKEYPQGSFDLITASPVCLWWSNCRRCWVGRKIKSHGDKVITMEILDEDINKHGKPMVDKVREIIEYFNPKYFWIENPDTGRMKEYITDLPYYIVDYCQYGFDYKKRTRIWTNIKNFTPKKCNKNTCEKMMSYVDNGKVRHRHVVPLGGHIKQRDGATSQGIKVKQNLNKFDKYKIPEKLIKDLIECITIYPN